MPQRHANARQCAALAAALTLVGGAMYAPRPLAAQNAVPMASRTVDARDSLATLRLTVRHDDDPVPGAAIRSLDATDAAGRAVGAQTDAGGGAVVRLPAGDRRLVISRVGYRADTLAVTLRAAQDTSVVVRLESLAEVVETFVVSATRAERRVEDTPLRVEVVDEEEVGEKLAMRPASIQMLLAETGGLRVQTTSPSIGNANVRVQGLRGRYALLLTDGLPLAGDGGGFSLLQTPIDLGRVEVLKGATGLYSGGAGGVINLVSRRPGKESEHTALLNQTSRGGSDALAFFTGPLGDRWGYTLLTGVHRQQRNDLDADGWTDMPGYDRVAVRPRLFYDDGAGRTAFVTAGFTTEDRTGGTMRAGVLPGGASFAEELQLQRGDVGALARWAFTDATTPAALRALRGAIVTVRGSAMEQRHRHRFGEVREHDRHRTAFGEASIAVPRGRATYVAGAAFQQDAYRHRTVDGWNYTFNTPAAFAQVDVDPAAWLSLSSSARVDAHNVYGTFVNPRLSVLLRSLREGALARWTARLSGGTGLYAPTPLVEEVEAVGLTPVVPVAGGVATFIAERARSASFDVGGPLALETGTLEVNATAFASQLANPLQARAANGVTASGASRLALANAPAPTRTWGTELLARLVRPLGDDRDGDEEAPALRVTATYAYLRATECDPDGITGTACARREVPLTPRHAATFVASLEQEGKSRVGLELYYTGRQSLERDVNPYRAQSHPYVLVGLLGERAFTTRAGVARLFVNLENLTNVRQTRIDPLLLPSRGRGGRWSTDAWTELVGFTVNGGVRFGF
ncbi:TonB-dependent receptor plug domain-containing protein [Gemmatimonas sp.]|uniref:TonB-dependent receptor n=1 Tax=Gemmatimonas sp. TaxID=1962908 RepID=UPI0022BEE4DB|nr:TonB-dependent receptor plug domain-containing protein [Gemmatimonas sp.]MCZ8204312.1 TonB-dependent receptor [Gemmatimonas sp.]